MMLTGAHSTDAWIIPQLRYSTTWEATPSCPALGLAPPPPRKESPMAMIDVIDDLDRCKIALQYVADMQGDSLTTVLELLLERLEDTIGQVQTQLRQGPCPVHTPARVTPVPAPRRGLTL